MSAAIDLPTIVAPTELHGQIRSGVQRPLERLGAENYSQFQIVADGGRLLAIVHAADGKVIYDRVFPDP
jgi:hypothetical protein